MTNEEVQTVGVKISGVLDKFDGDPIPENLVERIYIEDDAIVKREFFDGIENKLGEELTNEGGIN